MSFMVHSLQFSPGVMSWLLVVQLRYTTQPSPPSSVISMIQQFEQSFGIREVRPYKRPRNAPIGADLSGGNGVFDLDKLRRLYLTHGGSLTNQRASVPAGVTQHKLDKKPTFSYRHRTNVCAQTRRP